MIYTLEYDYSQGMYETDWLDTLKRTGLEYKTLVNDMVTGQHVINNKRYLESNIDYLQSILTEDDYLLMDSAFVFEQPNLISLEIKDVYKLLREKLKYKKILIFHPDNGYGDTGGDDIEFIFPQYDINWSSNKCKSQYNMYLNNTGKNKNRWLNMLLALRFDNMLRYKHFQFTNGVFKEHRTLLYGYLKKDGLLNTCFTSYLGYDIEGQSTPYYKDHFESLNTNRLSNDEYEDIVKDLPHVLDTEWTGNVGQDSTIIPYSSNSYFHLVGCTNYKCDRNQVPIYTSEKIFKPYLSWQIPIFFGVPGLYKVLKKLGFDVFEDIFDMSFDNELNDMKRFELQYKNVKKIAKMSKQEVHNTYRSNLHRIENNFKNLETLADNYVKVLKNKLNDSKA